jgi:hypothetical protein
LKEAVENDRYSHHGETVGPDIGPEDSVRWALIFVNAKKIGN